MPDDRATVAERAAPAGVEVRPTAPHRPRSLLFVAVALSLALCAGGVLVLRQFTAAPASSAPINPAPTRTSTPQALEAALDAARQYLNNQDFAKAQIILSEAVEKFPTDQQARLEFARVLVAQQKFADAYPQYEAALALGSSAADPALNFEAGTIASKAGFVDRAAEHYSMAQSADMTDPRFPLYLGMVQLRQNDDAAAQASLVRSITLDPNQPAAWGTLAELALKSNQFGMALQHIEKARKLDPSTPRWRLVEAKALKRRLDPGDVEHAAQVLLAMDRSEQLKPDVALVLAECYGLLHRPEAAATLFADASRASPGNGEMAYQAATWYERAGDAAQALRYAKLASTMGNEEARNLVAKLSEAPSQP